MATSEPVPAPAAPHKVTLAEFVEDNSKLITGFVAFIALTTFLAQQDDANLKSSLSGITLIAAVLILFELIVRSTERPPHWRLELFQRLLIILIVGIGWYWLKRFVDLWLPIAFSLISIVLWVGTSGVIATLASKYISFPAPVMLPRADRDEKLQRRVWIATFFLFLVVIYLGAMLFLHTRKNHQIVIPIKCPTIICK